MKTSIERITIWWSILCVIGCTSMHPVVTTKRPLDIEFKDRIVVYEKSGRILDLKIVKVNDDSLTGALVENPLTPITVNFNDIEKLEVESIDGTKTTFAILGGVLLLPLVLIGVIIGVAEGIDNAN